MDWAKAKLLSWLNNPRVRRVVYQTFLLGCIGALSCVAIYNATINIRARGIPMGF